MNQENPLIRWNELFEDNRELKRKLIKLQKEVDIHSTNFFDDLKIINNTIYGRFDVGFSSINFVTIKKIIDAWWEKSSFQESDYFFICSDGSEETKEIIDKILKFNHNKIKFLAFSNLEGFDKKFISNTIKKLKPKASIHIFKSIFDTNIINVNLYNEEGYKVSSIELNEIIKSFKKNTNEIIRNDIENISYLNNDSLIKIFAEKISSLFPRNKVSRKAKIAISNRSNGITKIFSKLLGSKDFSYTINNKIRKKNFDILNKPYMNDLRIKWFFWDEILFAKKRNANILIIYNQEGTQTYIFALQGTKIIYINENLITLIFLHDFYNGLALNNKSIPNLFIASNENPNANILNIIKKYKIDFRKIKNNNFNSKDYMLLYWNDYNQAIFGENENDEFTIYHLLIKIISILDYYIRQYNSVIALFNNMSKMYGDFVMEEKLTFDLSKEETNNKIKNFIEIDKNKKNFTNIKYYEKQDSQSIENDMWELTTETGEIIRIKYNEIINKVFINLIFNKNSNIIKRAKDNIFDRKQFIKKLLK